MARIFEMLNAQTELNTRVAGARMALRSAIADEQRAHEEWRNAEGSEKPVKWQGLQSASNRVKYAQSKLQRLA